METHQSQHITKVIKTYSKGETKFVAVLRSEQGFSSVCCINAFYHVNSTITSLIIFNNMLGCLSTMNETVSLIPTTIYRPGMLAYSCNHTIWVVETSGSKLKVNLGSIVSSNLAQHGKRMKGFKRRLCFHFSCHSTPNNHTETAFITKLFGQWLRHIIYLLYLNTSLLFYILPCDMWFVTLHPSSWVATWCHSDSALFHPLSLHGFPTLLYSAL